LLYSSFINRALLFSFLFFYHSIPGNTEVLDTIPPTGHITDPQEWNVLTSNAVRVSVLADDKESGVKSVRFFASYTDPNFDKTVLTQIGSDSAAPFEIIWDCTTVPDQSVYGLTFYCRIEDSAGNVFVTDRYHYAVLDRHSDLPNKEIKSIETHANIKIDGKLEEREGWFEQGPLQFQNGDNVYKIYTCWDMAHLYFGVEVKDDHVFTRYTKLGAQQFMWDSTTLKGTDTLMNQVWWDDCIGFFFDVNANHSSVLEPDDKKLYIAPTGVFLSDRIDIFTDLVYNWGQSIKCSTKVINRKKSKQTGNFSGFVIEVAIPWQSLGINPKKSKSMGFNLYLVDRERADGPRVTNTWSGEPRNHLNPSEWGKIILVEKKNYLNVGLSMLLLLVIVLSTPLLRKRFSKQAPFERKNKPEKEEIKMAKEYIHRNFMKDTLSRGEVARQLNLSAIYFGILFRKEVGDNFSNYLAKCRIEKAKELLQNTQKNISDIGFEVGFSEKAYFSRVFRKIAGISPKDFRQATQNPT